MKEDIKKEIVDLLEDLTYWDTCPQNYKDRIPTIIKALRQGQTLPIDSVIVCSRTGCSNIREKEHSYCLDCRYERTMSGY